MSLSQPNNTNTNPATKFLNWSSDESKFKYWDKEKSENVYLDLPFKFIKLDILSTITGYSDKDNSGFFGNEVRSTKVEPFTVRTKAGIKMEGLWSDIGDELKAQGGKFAASVYIALYNEKNELELCNVKFYGSSITQWINFIKENKGIGIQVTGSNKEKKGRTEYFTPVFEPLEVSEEDKQKAIELDKQLQVYLNSYFDYANEKAKSASASGEQSETSSKLDTNDDIEDSEIPF